MAGFQFTTNQKPGENLYGSQPSQADQQPAQQQMQFNQMLQQLIQQGTGPNAGTLGQLIRMLMPGQNTSNAGMVGASVNRGPASGFVGSGFYQPWQRQAAPQPQQNPVTWNPTIVQPQQMSASPASNASSVGDVIAQGPTGIYGGEPLSWGAGAIAIDPMTRATWQSPAFGQGLYDLLDTGPMPANAYTL